MAKLSTYARLLKPGQKWYVKDLPRVYTTIKVVVSTVEDKSTVQLGDKVAGPAGEVTMVQVFVEGRRAPILFDGDDRVQLTDR